MTIQTQTTVEPPTVEVSRRGSGRIASGHPWVYRTDVGQVRARGGDIVRVLGPRGRMLGHALFSDASQIALRVLTRPPDVASDELLGRRLADAIAYREALGIDATAYRVVHGEADRLPSLVVDRYGDYLVVQALSQAIDRMLPFLVDRLCERLQPAGVLARNDPRARELEGLPREVTLVRGEVPREVEVREGSVRLLVDPWRGQKTGLFLDQRENHEAARPYARGRLLDAFSYQGGFALTLGPRCEHVVALEGAAEPAARLLRNAALNTFEQLEVRTVNVFDELRRLDHAKARFDTIVLDPPAFAKSRGARERAAAGYKEINLRALRLLAPGGYLITCSCSHHVAPGMFLEIVAAAAADVRADVLVVEQRGQARDHPVLLGAPETAYLKCLILKKLA